MNVFFDTSSLFKLYHREVGTDELMDFFNRHKINAIYLAEITRIEFSSVVWKKCRKGEINEKLSIKLLEKFEIDSKKFTFVPDSWELKKLAKILIAKHWKKGLRTLDSLQLASGLIIDQKVDYYFTSDVILSEIASLEQLKTK